MKDEEKKETKGIFIPENILRHKDLSALAKIFYGEIVSICERDGFCNKTNAQLAELCNVKKCIISRWIKVFKGIKVLKISYRGKNKYIRFIFLPTVDKNTLKSTIRAYYSIVPRYKNIHKEYIEHSFDAHNNINFEEEDFDFTDEDINKWLDDINIK